MVHDGCTGYIQAVVHFRRSSSDGVHLIDQCIAELIKKQGFLLFRADDIDGVLSSSSAALLLLRRRSDIDRGSHSRVHRAGDIGDHDGWNDLGRGQNRGRHDEMS